MCGSGVLLALSVRRHAFRHVFRLFGDMCLHMYLDMCLGVCCSLYLFTDMHLDMRSDMCSDTCTDRRQLLLIMVPWQCYCNAVLVLQCSVHRSACIFRPVIRHVFMRVRHMWLDTCRSLLVFAGMRLDMCSDMCLDMCLGMCLDMCLGVCYSLFLFAGKRLMG